MPKNENIKKVLVPGPSPLELNQTSEYDYLSAGVCAALTELGVSIISVCSNPSYLINNNSISSSVYIEPLDTPHILNVIQTEQPDHILTSVSGALPYTLGQELQDNTLLEKFSLKMLNTNINFNLGDVLKSINQPYVEKFHCVGIETALKFAQEIGYPIKMQPLYTAEGKYVYKCKDADELLELGEPAIGLSPIRQISIERDISSYKKIELELLRDNFDNNFIIGTSEKVQPYFTSDQKSFHVSPAQTLNDNITDEIYKCAYATADSFNSKGNYTFTFAVSADNTGFFVTNISTRLNTTSAYIAKVYGFDICKAYAKILLGYSILEIDEITRLKGLNINYCAVKLPPNFNSDDHVLCDVTGFGTTFSMALLQALRGFYSHNFALENNMYSNLNIEHVLHFLNNDKINHDLFLLYRCATLGISTEKISQLTNISPFFINTLKSIGDAITSIKNQLNQYTYNNALSIGLSDHDISNLSSKTTTQFKNIGSFDALCYNKKSYYYSAKSENSFNKLSDNSVMIIGDNLSKFSGDTELSFALSKFTQVAKSKFTTTLIAGNTYYSTAISKIYSDRVYNSLLLDEDIDNIIKIEQPQAVLKINSSPLTDDLLGEIAEKIGIDYTNTKLIKKVATLYTLECVYDGENLLVSGIVEVLDKTGNTFTDSYMAYPAVHCSKVVSQNLIALSKKIAPIVGSKGFLNITFAVTDINISLHYITTSITKNTSTISLLTGIDVASLSAHCMLGTKLNDFNLDLSTVLSSQLVAVIAPIFPTKLLNHSAGQFDGNKKSIGEIVGIASNYKLAMKKALDSQAMTLQPGSVFISVKQDDKPEVIHLADMLSTYGYDIYATAGTASVLNRNMIPASRVKKLHEGLDNTLDLVDSMKLNLCILTSDFTAYEDDVKILRAAKDQGIQCFTSIETAKLVIEHLCKF